MMTPHYTHQFSIWLNKVAMPTGVPLLMVWLLKVHWPMVNCLIAVVEWDVCMRERGTMTDGEVLTSSSCGVWLAYILWFIIWCLWWSYCACSECLNGTIKCIRDFCNTTDGSLSDDQLGLLKSDMLHLFHFQFQHNDRHILIYLRNIRITRLGKHQCACIR